MRFHVPRQAGELAGLAVAGLAQLRGSTQPSASSVGNNRSSARAALLSIKAAGSEAISPAKFAWPAGSAAIT